MNKVEMLKSDITTIINRFAESIFGFETVVLRRCSIAAVNNIYSILRVSTENEQYSIK